MWLGGYSVIPTEQVEDFTIEEEPTNTYQLHYDKNRVIGMTDELEAMKQAVYKMLSTERYEFMIYDVYGVELSDLIGKERSFVVPEIERRITDALLEDTRILKVGNFKFEFNKSKYLVTFDVETIYGELEIESEVAA